MTSMTPLEARALLALESSCPGLVRRSVIADARRVLEEARSQAA